MGTRLGGSPERPARFFDGPADFRAWLAANHDGETELWMGLVKKHVTPRGLTWEEAVQEALCYGWIDSVVQRIDEDSVRQRWTPRTRRSTWSNVNVALVERLTAQGRMQPAGLAAFARRSEDRQGVYAYEQAETAELPPGYAERLAASPQAAAFWADAPPSYRRMCVHWVLAAKREATRERRMGQLVEDCALGRLIKPQRYGEAPAWLTRRRPDSDS